MLALPLRCDWLTRLARGHRMRVTLSMSVLEYVVFREERQSRESNSASFDFARRLSQ